MGTHAFFDLDHLPANDCPAPDLSAGLAGSPALHRLCEAGRVIDYPADRTLWEDDESPAMAGLVLSGFLRVQRYDFEGRRQILCLSQPGEIVGERFFRRRGYSVETASRVRLLRFDARQFERLASEDTGLRRLTYLQYASRLERLRWMTWAIATLSTEQRYATFLAIAARIMPSSALPDGSRMLRLAISRRDIADLLATSTETLCRLNKKLQRDGLIRLEGPAELHLMDPGALLRMGGLGAGIDSLLRTGIDTGALGRLEALSAPCAASEAPRRLRVAL